MKAITVSNFRANLKTHLDEVSENSDIIVIPRNNKESDAIVVMSISEYNSIKETEYLLESQANAKRLHESLSQIELGQTKSVELESLLK